MTYLVFDLAPGACHLSGTLTPVPAHGEQLRNGRICSLSQGNQLLSPRPDDVSNASKYNCLGMKN